MPETRRNFIQKSLSLVATALAASSSLLTTAAQAMMWPIDKFAETTITETMGRLVDNQKVTETDKINIKLPRIAENGSLVPVTITSSLKNITSVSILVEKNPVPLAATFSLSPGAEPFVSARLKMAETCNVIALITADDQFYSARKKVKVTIGGCGG